MLLLKCEKYSVLEGAGKFQIATKRMVQVSGSLHLKLIQYK